MSRYVFDMEGNGLLYQATKIHCICMIDLDSKEELSYPPDKVEEGVGRIADAELVVGHNILGYDLPLIKKLYPDFIYPEFHDTFVMSSLFFPDRPGGHSIAQYGEEFGIPKPMHEDWERFSEEMLYRCMQDTRINVKVWERLSPRLTEDF